VAPHPCNLAAFGRIDAVARAGAWSLPPTPAKVAIAFMSEQSAFLPTTAALMPLPEASDALPLGTRLGDFEIREVIGVGGFGIVYRAWEHSLERDVALKEYMPMGLVRRDADGHVKLRAPSYEEDYALGLRSFRNEARLLARFDHPALVKVHRFWEAHGTAYMAMPFYKAQTLRQRRQEPGSEPVTEAWLLQLIEALLGALSEMHRVEVYHRDIAPDNILWCADHRPVLLDFGAARRVLADRTQHLTAVLKPQFAPIEQYAAEGQSMRQGPWTDVFALASTCYFMLTGRPPLPATARILSDDLVPLAQLAPAGFSAHVLAALDWAMAVLPQDRPQSAAALRDALLGRVPVPERFAEPRAAGDRTPVPTGSYVRTVPTNERAPGGTPAGGTASGPGGARAAVARSAASARRGRPEGRAVVASARRFQWPLLAIVLVAGASYAWLEHGHAAREATEPAADAEAADGTMPASSAPRPADATSTAVTAADEQARARALQEPVAAAAATEAPAAVASAPLRAAAATVPAAPQGPRELCLASKSPNVDECVRRVCKSEPRFRRFAACLRLQRQNEPWWKIFKPG
jgi:hypothetical protein